MELIDLLVDLFWRISRVSYIDSQQLLVAKSSFIGFDLFHCPVSCKCGPTYIHFIQTGLFIYGGGLIQFWHFTKFGPKTVCPFLSKSYELSRSRKAKNFSRISNFENAMNKLSRAWQANVLRVTNFSNKEKQRFLEEAINITTGNIKLSVLKQNISWRESLSIKQRNVLPPRSNYLMPQ